MTFQGKLMSVSWERADLGGSGWSLQSKERLRQAGACDHHVPLCALESLHVVSIVDVKEDVAARVEMRGRG